jgi:hypothetical protein
LQDREVATVTPNFCDPAVLDLPLQAAAAKAEGSAADRAGDRRHEKKPPPNLFWEEKAAAEVLHAPVPEGAVQPSTPREAERISGWFCRCPSRSGGPHWQSSAPP